jgi:hypothetical protein
VRVELHAALAVRARQPRDALLALRAGDYLPVPIDDELRLGEPVFGVRLLSR